MRVSALRLVNQLKQHGVLDMQAGELGERRRRHDDLAAVRDVVARCARQHCDAVAAEALAEHLAPVASEEILRVVEGELD